MKTLDETIISAIVDSELDVSDYNQVLSDGSIYVTYNDIEYCLDIDFNLSQRTLKTYLIDEDSEITNPSTELLSWLFEYLENLVETHNEDEQRRKADYYENLGHQMHHFGYGK